MQIGREVPAFECYGGGPADGETLPLVGSEVVVFDGSMLYVYRLFREDDGTRFLRLVESRRRAA